MVELKTAQYVHIMSVCVCRVAQTFFSALYILANLGSWGTYVCFLRVKCHFSAATSGVSSRTVSWLVNNKVCCWSSATDHLFCVILGIYSTALLAIVIMTWTILLVTLAEGKCFIINWAVSQCTTVAYTRVCGNVWCMKSPIVTAPAPSSISLSAICIVVW